MTNYLEKNGLPGASIVVVKDGKVLYEKVYGHDSDGKPLTANSKLGIASGTKPFTFQSQQDIVPSSGYAVAVLLNSFTPTFEHAYEISLGIIQLTEVETVLDKLLKTNKSYY